MTTITTVNKKSAIGDEEGMLRKTLATVDVKRKALESESEAITSELLAEPEPGVPPMGIDTPLVDADGYPRGDVDVYRARTLRGRLAVIRTDYKALMRESEDLLYQLAALKVRSWKCWRQLIDPDHLLNIVLFSNLLPQRRIQRNTKRKRKNIWHVQRQNQNQLMIPSRANG